MALAGTTRGAIAGLTALNDAMRVAHERWPEGAVSGAAATSVARHSRVEPQRHRRVAQVVAAAAQRRPALRRGECFFLASARTAL